MQHRLTSSTLLGLGLVILLFSAASVPPAWTGARPADIDTAPIDRYVESEMRAARIPGLALGIVKGDHIVFLKGYGVSDATGRPVTPQTPFFLGSVSKSFTALAVMQLAEAGKLDLDASVQKYLPWFTVADPSAGRQITVRHLLNHTSGIPTYDGEVAFVGRPQASIEDLMREQAALVLAGPPGQRFRYSNINYIALGGLIEAVSGQSYAQYVVEHIFAPLSMVHSYASLAAAASDGLATGHQYFFGWPRPTPSLDSPATAPAGRLISSAEDMARYLAMWLSDDQPGDVEVVSAAGRQALQQPAAAVTSYVRYGMGWYTNPEGSVVWHGGSTENFRASVKILHQERLAVVALYNLTDDTLQAIFGEGYMIQDGVISILYGERPPASGFIGTGRVYYVLDALAVLLVGAVVFGALRVRRWRAALERGRRQRAAAIVMMFLLNLTLPLAVLAGVPRAVAWPVVLANIPDYGYLVIGVAVALLLIGCVEAGIWITSARKPGVLTPPPEAAGPPAAS